MKKETDTNCLINFKKKTRKWIKAHQIGFGLFNVLIMLMILLRSAGYFEPYMTISINLIFIVALLSAIFLLEMRDRGAFGVALVFWFIAGILRVFKIDVWAERAALYTFEALFVGVLLLILETIFKKNAEA
ncbi:MAG: hypothetical protein A3D24_01935 [Candidatus Blackburnbacteria bacterium RIFCSPHIGHO2_02_FULL_39_13]|uniref:Uncharacterized protein n=1 Tax=Candidatus Blackburnbacteria bacterium RIFCSPLOWO2_01_FULL_40_20 TaxID=1797519 RepID=A0A1G1VDW2_9BACT|nr:MAG: hypothetical protein A2694_04185 [Candidatus Blackburnbacteria bacterium RIFCSPHIGHO2_01_FULL_40_17]OGY09160.1 MAG: hypothetical protein A3D24_01935 [Candidatus Blackburnbacteria bacterium RIFCSPHIGHO2_02_FULL_39_13]OGY13604.1 MAG: hypothetical protein A3A77_04420 [Candidatus Blackburnbacteria bacterium RIFCSPLOWO2_01_FULL_40_20]HBL52257.1 hypothetical protein [Candidatus Blackburnbacteria bacterium]